MKRSLALSLLAALSGSTYAVPAFTALPTSGKTVATHTQPIESTELSEKQRIMLEVRMQVGSELQDS